MSQEAEAELARIPLFQKLGGEEIARLAGLASRRRVPSETCLFFQGDQSDSLYLFLSGSAKVYQTLDDGHEKILRVARAGDLVGEFAIIEGRPRSASVQLLEDSELLVLRRQDVQAYMLAHPQALWTVATSLCARIRELGEETIDLSYREVPYRLLRKIVELAERHGQPTPDGVKINFDVSLSDLASMVGTTREMVRRYLHRMAAENLLLLEGQTLVVPDLAAARRAQEYVAEWF